MTTYQTTTDLEAAELLIQNARSVAAILANSDHADADDIKRTAWVIEDILRKALDQLPAID